MSLISRYLEENGVPTVMIAAARDIVEHCGVARLLFVDFPLGSPCGEPGAVDQQRQIFDMALELLESATGPRSVKEAGFRWSQGERWKELIFSDEQPFLSPEAHEKWMASKEAYRELKAEGKI